MKSLYSKPVHTRHSTFNCTAITFIFIVLFVVVILIKIVLLIPFFMTMIGIASSVIINDKIFLLESTSYKCGIFLVSCQIKDIGRVQLAFDVMNFLHCRKSWRAEAECIHNDSC